MKKCKLSELGKEIDRENKKISRRCKLMDPFLWISCLIILLIFIISICFIGKKAGEKEARGFVEPFSLTELIEDEKLEQDMQIQPVEDEALQEDDCTQESLLDIKREYDEDTVVDIFSQSAYNQKTTWQKTGDVKDLIRRVGKITEDPELGRPAEILCLIAAFFLVLLTWIITSFIRRPKTIVYQTTAPCPVHERPSDVLQRNIEETVNAEQICGHKFEENGIYLKITSTKKEFSDSDMMNAPAVLDLLEQSTGLVSNRILTIQYANNKHLTSQDIDEKIKEFMEKNPDMMVERIDYREFFGLDER